MTEYDYDWIWLNMTEYEYNWIWLNVTEYDWIWQNINMTEYDWTRLNMNEYEWIWLPPHSNLPPDQLKGSTQYPTLEQFITFFKPSLRNFE